MQTHLPLLIIRLSIINPTNLKFSIAPHGQQNETPYVSYLCLIHFKFFSNWCPQGNIIQHIHQATWYYHQILGLFFISDVDHSKHHIAFMSIDLTLAWSSLLLWSIGAKLSNCTSPPRRSVVSQASSLPFTLSHGPSQSSLALVFTFLSCLIWVFQHAINHICDDAQLFLWTNLHFITHSIEKVRPQAGVDPWGMPCGPWHTLWDSLTLI
jgi:hypothetical protein